ncbi:MaoC family dehydratase [Flexithrix dorotheae]|uniref:MaoC family dehydratase n=1 Tax=Flexithrix dorotheae TaxID=70993 RepID=UPI00035EB6E5|nr:MaoC family dehydratase [Flexithrix dorotheae]
MNKIIIGKEKFGNYYDDFEVGSIYKHWPGKTITESDNNIFSLLTMNHHPVHLDANFCQTHQHKQVLVVGTLVLSVVVGLTVSDISGKAIANLEYEKINHDGPVFIGDTLYAETCILDKRLSKKNPTRGIIYVETMARNQRNEKILTLRRKVLVPVSNNENK